MNKTYILPKNLRSKLRRPWGKRFFGKEKEVLKEFEKFIKNKKFKKVITVGDFCSKTLPSNVKIFDGKIKRKSKNTKNIAFFILSQFYSKFFGFAKMKK